MFSWIVPLLLLLSQIISLYGYPKYEDCGSKVGTLKSLEVIPCDEEECTLHKGQNATIKLTFATNNEVVKGTAKVHGVIAMVPIPFPLDDDNICNFVSPACPLLPSVDITYTFSLPILQQYPSIQLAIKWELKDEHDSDIVCVEFPAQISD